MFDNAAIEHKVDEVTATHPGLEVETGCAALSQEEPRAMLDGEIPRDREGNQSGQLPVRASRELLEQLAALALLENENVKGLACVPHPLFYDGLCPSDNDSVRDDRARWPRKLVAKR